MAAGTDGLRAGAGGKAACWRVAGAMIGAAGAGALTFLAVFAAPSAVFVDVLGTTLRAIGRGFGNGIFGLSEAFKAHAGNAITSARLVTRAVDKTVDRKASART
jgi:hypothetical protein